MSAVSAVSDYGGMAVVVVVSVSVWAVGVSDREVGRAAERAGGLDMGWMDRDRKR